MFKRVGFYLLGAVALLAACAAPPPSPTAPPTATASATATPAPSHTPPPPTPTATPPSTDTPPPHFDPAAWEDLPVVPTADAALRALYQRGQQLGNRPRAFSKIGDCESAPTWFLGDFDRGPRYYQLGPYADLQDVIDYFAGSYARESLAARSGFSAASMFDPFWTDPAVCKLNEGPLPCEYRLQQPSFVFVMLGTNDLYHQDVFETEMRRIITYSLDRGIIPILATKADNLEGDGQINAIIARLATEYNVPLWNFWRAVQPLPDHGLQPDGAHITWKPNRFDDPVAMERGWPWRNLTALQALESIWRGVTAP